MNYAAASRMPFTGITTPQTVLVYQRTPTIARTTKIAALLLALTAATSGAQVINESVTYAENPPVVSARFDCAVAANNDIVGARGANAPGDGSVSIYDRQTGAFIRNLIPTNGANILRFGAQIAIEGNIIVVSNAIYREETFIEFGVYVFDATTGNHRQPTL